MNTQGTVFIIDDDPAVLKALERLLRSHGFQVQAFGSTNAFLEKHDPSVPGCLLLDVIMPEQNGLDLQRLLANSGCHRMIVFLSGRSDVTVAATAMRAGAVHFLSKPFRPDDLLNALHEALEKDRRARMAQAQAASVRERLDRLTPREREVLQHVVAGRLNKQIAFELGTVEKTVKVHRARMMRKMGVQSVAELVRVVERFGSSPSPLLDQDPI
jgi:FixJ family two-component response regulator